MAKPKTIYSLKGIFSNLLEDTEKKSFMIPAYQRGYKWTSLGINSQVELLMADLFSAYETNRDRYYLQFLTLKIKGEELEVIDGQQRLTTLTILFCILNELIKSSPEEVFIKNKLNYQIRENFIEKYIYEDINSILKSKSWEDFIKDNHDLNNQDVYFIYSASVSIYEFLSKLQESQLKKFYYYICEKVSLIVNLMDSDMNSEKVFINVNKGVKLQDEDLVKGLLITKMPFDNQNQQNRISEIEINEMRVNIGRQWDDMTLWASRLDIRNYFKINSNDRLEWLISLTYPLKEDTDLNPIFNYLDNLYRSGKIPATEIFLNIRKTMFALNDLFCEPELCNLLGYNLHSYNNIGLSEIWKELNGCNTKVEVLEKLKKMSLNLLPPDIMELNYEDSKPKLFNLFLMLDVVKFLPINNHYCPTVNIGNSLK